LYVLYCCTAPDPKFTIGSIGVDMAADWFGCLGMEPNELGVINIRSGVAIAKDII
jgi:hypothetical protein